MRCDFLHGGTSEQHQRRKWDGLTQGHDPSLDRLAACPSGPPSCLRGSAAPNKVVFGQVKKMRAAFPQFSESEVQSKSYDPAELAALLSEPWSNGTCRGYVIMAMENCGFADQDIRRIMAELYELFDFVSLDEAEAHYQKSPY